MPELMLERVLYIKENSMKMFGAQVKGHSDNYQFKHKNLLTLKSCYMKQITCRYALCRHKIKHLYANLRNKVKGQMSKV